MDLEMRLDERASGRTSGAGGCGLRRRPWPLCGVGTIAGLVVAVCLNVETAAAQELPVEPLPPPVPGDTVMAGPRPVTGKIRLGLPVIHHVQFVWSDREDGHRLGDGFDYLGMPLVGLEGGVEVYEWIAFEVGAYIWIESGISQDFSARVGIVPVVADGRDAQATGWTLQLPLLVGYELYNVNTEVDGSPRNWLVHGLNLRAGLDATHWWPTWGLTGRLVAVGGPALGKSSDRDPESVTAQAARGHDFEGFLGFDCTLGVAF